MLKDRGEPVGLRRCGLKYAPIGWDCDAANLKVSSSKVSL